MKKVNFKLSESEFNEFEPRLKSTKTGYNWAPAQIQPQFWFYCCINAY